MIDQYLPAKAQSLRQKMTELGMSVMHWHKRSTRNQGDPTADALVQAAATAPQQMQSRLYQQAAYKALEEGDTRARAPDCQRSLASQCSRQRDEADRFS